jgi:hypothetical protein
VSGKLGYGELSFADEGSSFGRLAATKADNSSVSRQSLLPLVSGLAPLDPCNQIDARITCLTSGPLTSG